MDCTGCGSIGVAVISEASFRKGGFYRTQVQHHFPQGQSQQFVKGGLIANLHHQFPFC